MGEDSNLTRLACFPSSKLLISTDYLTTIASTNFATTYAHFMSARAVQGNQSLSFDCL
nr:MAG TPA: hypothetical protein [Caudoviricetes sp.]